MPRSWTLLLATVSYLGGTAIAADYRVGIGDDCLAPTGCFSPAALTIDVGDSVTSSVSCLPGGEAGWMHRSCLMRNVCWNTHLQRRAPPLRTPAVLQVHG